MAKSCESFHKTIEEIVKPKTLRRQCVTRLNVRQPFITSLTPETVNQVDVQFHAS